MPTRPAALALLLVASPASGQAPRPPLRWAADPTGGAPYVYQDAAGRWTGFEWDLAAYVGAKLGREPVLRTGDWDKLPQWLGRPASDPDGIDVVLNGYEQRDDLARLYAATRPYFVYRLQLLVNRADYRIQGWADLPGKRVGVLTGSAAHDYLRGVNGVDLFLNPDVATVIGQVAATPARLDATVQDTPAAAYYLRQSPALRTAGEPRRPGFYVIYLRKGDDELRQGIDAALEYGLRDGSLRRIYDKYGLWSADQEWLTYTRTGSWPADPDGPTAADADGPGGNPWPRLLGELVRAAGMTIFLAVTSFPLAVVLGVLVAVGRVYGPGWLAAPLGVYVEVLRGTPLLLQLYVVFYLLPTVHPAFTLSPVGAGVLGLAVNYSAYEAENYRAGLLAVPRGQREAALALGMTPLTALRRVILPQAARVVLPPVTNDFIALFKDTSVCSVILITELTRKYNELYNFNREYVAELAFVTAGLYLLMSYPLGVAARRLERRLGAR